MGEVGCERSMAYCLGNNCTKNYISWSYLVQVIMENEQSYVFETQCMYLQSETILRNSPFVTNIHLETFTTFICCVMEDA